MLIGIFGAGRNGSTLLMRLLDGSPGLWVHPIELNYLRRFSPSGRRRARRLAKLVLSKAWSSSARETVRVKSMREWVKAQLAEIENAYVRPLSDSISINQMPLKTLEGRIGRSLEEDLISFLQATRSAYDDRELVKDPFLVFKSTEIDELPRYARLFPDMRFIHIVRDPLSNYESLKRTDMVSKGKPFWFQGGDILRAQIEDRWLPHARFILARGAEEKDRHCVVRYEDLCEDAGRVVKAVCDWLHIPPKASPSTLTVLGGKRVEELPDNPSQLGIKTPTHVVRHMATAFRYDDVLTGRERDLILFRTYRLGRRLGYFGQVQAVDLPSRASLLTRWLLPDKWEFMNAHERVRLLIALFSRRAYIARALLFSGVRETGINQSR